MSDTENGNRLPEIYALIWRSTATDEEFDQAEFEKRIPRLMEWLRNLHADGRLVGCGGGGFEHHAGGLTLIRAADAGEAQRLSEGSPMNEIGSTEIFLWDVFYADLVLTERKENLERSEKREG